MTCDYRIKSIYPHQVGVVTNSTILLAERSSDDANREDCLSEDDNSCPHSSISVVREIISRVVMPVTYPHLTGHRSVRLKGLLLVGPPGVGKTYAVRAVKHLCRSICNVRNIACSTVCRTLQHTPIAIQPYHTLLGQDYRCQFVFNSVGYRSASYAGWYIRTSDCCRAMQEGSCFCDPCHLLGGSEQSDTDCFR